MPKLLTFNPLFDNAHQINTINLRNWGYLEFNQIKSGVITWSRNGHKTGSISITVTTVVKQPYFEFDYNYNNKRRNYNL